MVGDTLHDVEVRAGAGRLILSWSTMAITPEKNYSAPMSKSSQSSGLVCGSLECRSLVSRALRLEAASPASRAGKFMTCGWPSLS